MQAVAFAVLVGWALDVHVPGLDEPLAPEPKVENTRVEVQPLAPPAPVAVPQVFDNKTEIKSYKAQLQATRAQQWREVGQQVTQAFVELTNINELPNLIKLPNLEDLPEYFTLADMPRIPDMPSLDELPRMPDMPVLEDVLQNLPLQGMNLPLETASEAAPMPQAASAAMPSREETQAVETPAVQQVIEIVQELAHQVVEAAQNGIEEFSQTAASSINEVAEAASPGVTQVANAVEAEVAPVDTPLEPTADWPVAVAAPTQAPVAATEPAQVAPLVDTPAPLAVNTPAPLPAISSEAPPIAASEVIATAPATVQTETAAPLYPKVGSPKPEEPPSVVLKEIRFKGAKYFSNESLQAMVSKFLSIPLQYNDLLDIGFAVENFYKKNNHLARVMLAQQDVTEGVLTLDVIESKLSKVTVDQQVDALPSTQEHVLALIERQHPKGSTFNANQVDRALALANEVPGISVSGALHEGEELGETELILKLYQNHGRQAELVADNIGSRSTGSQRLMGNATFINPGDRGDTVSLSTILTQGSEYLRGAYSLPIGLDGWRLGVNASAMDYKVVVGEPGLAGAFGKAFTEGLELIYPVERSPSANSTFTLSAEAKQFKNIMQSGTILSDYDAEVLVAQFSGVDREFTKTSGMLNYNFQLSHGLINLHEQGTISKSNDQNGINGDFNKLRVNLTYLEPWTPKTDIYMGFNGQLADKNLDSSEKFQLGGANGIRAYPTGEGSGSDGKMLNFELRHRFDNGVTLTGFYDWGHIDDLHNPNPANNNSKNSYDLKGFGLSAGYNFRNGVAVKATWATRDGDNPNPKIPSGADQDGSRDRNRYWLQVTIPF